MMKPKTLCKFLAVKLILSMLLVTAPAGATDLLRLASDSATRGSGDIVGMTPTALTALSANPAFLNDIPDSTRIAASAVVVDGGFTSSLGESSDADDGPGLIPEIAIKRSVGDSGWSWGAGFVVQSALEADFFFTDPPGTAGVSYGPQRHRSSYLVAKASGALSYEVSERLSVGFNLAVLYNRNQLEAPYIFQSHPALTGLKVLVDLEADDYALNAGAGLHYELARGLNLNLAYTMETDFSADGDVSGNLGQLGLGIQEDFSYQINVDTALPASFIAGLSWQASDRLKLGVQFDRLRWQKAFDELPLTLTEGSNAELNAFLGSNGLMDTAPLAWRDQDTVHVGLEYGLNKNLLLRAGFEDSEAATPARTATPMTAAILDKAYSVGARTRLGESVIDLYYRYSDGSDLFVGDSALAGGEYDNTHTRLRLHSFGVSVSF